MFKEDSEINLKKKTFTQWLTLLGVVGVLFYFLHVLFGRINYPGYNALKQAVSDLTATTSPSREIAAPLSTVYAIFTAAACTVLCIFFQGKEQRIFRIGIYLFAIMQWLSAVGYTLFPLSDSGYSGQFQDIMHMVVTGFVVPLSITSMILIAVGCLKNKMNKAFGVLTIVVLGMMAVGSISTGIVSPECFGVPERISVYSIVVYTGLLSIFAFSKSYV